VIPHVELPRHRLSGEERSPFARGSKERKLRIVVDRATVPEDEALELLLGLGHHPLIELLSTRAESFAHLDIGPIDQHKDKAPAVIRRPDGSRTHLAVWPPHTSEAFAERYLRDHPDLGDTDELLRVLLLASASRDRGADALVTASPVLIDPAHRGPVARHSNAMPAKAALALVGLYLRARDDFTLRRLPGLRETFGRGLFYWVLASRTLSGRRAWLSSVTKPAGRGALADGTGAGPAGEQGLQLAQQLPQRQADAAGFGRPSRSKVRKPWATETKVTWWCQPPKLRPS
jgi:hypothetical protein